MARSDRQLACIVPFLQKVHRCQSKLSILMEDDCVLLKCETSWRPFEFWDPSTPSHVERVGRTAENHGSKPTTISVGLRGYRLLWPYFLLGLGLQNHNLARSRGPKGQEIVGISWHFSRISLRPTRSTWLWKVAWNFEMILVRPSPVAGKGVLCCFCPLTHLRKDSAPRPIAKAVIIVLCRRISPI